MTDDNDQISLLAAGDVFVDSPSGIAAFRHVSQILAKGDLVVANCEGVYSDRPAYSPTARHASTTALARGQGLGKVPFHVMGLANNHILDGGFEAMFDTVELLRQEGILTAGVGKNLAEALQPATISRGGIRFAFIAVCTVFPVGYEARENRAGLAPLRVRTFYSTPDPTFWEPGVAPIITTTPVPEDVERLNTAIREARKNADVVIVLCHWGNSSVYATIQDYETRLARGSIESGADVILCHHHHSLRALEFHQGKPIYYGLGAFLHQFKDFHATPRQQAESRARYGEYAHGLRPGFPLFPFHEDARMTGLATLDFSRSTKRPGVGFFPAQVLGDGSTEPLRIDDERANAILAYLRKLTDQSGFATCYDMSERWGWAHFTIKPGETSVQSG